MKNKERERERERERGREGGRYYCHGEVNFPTATPKLHVLERIFFWEKNVLERLKETIQI